MSRIADNIRVRQQWGEDGYTFEPKVESVTPTPTQDVSTPAGCFFDVLVNHYDRMGIDPADVRDAIDAAMGFYGAAGSPSSILNRQNRDVVKTRVERLLEDGSTGARYQIDDGMSFIEEGWL